jgi:hypothetical protein
VKGYIVLGLAAALLALGSLFAGASGVAASYSCTAGGTLDVVGTGTGWVKLYETQDYNVGQDGAHSGILCVRAATNGGLNLADMKGVTYSNDSDTSATCDGQLITSHGTWNDCVGSMRVSIDCHHSVAAWDDSGFSGNLLASWSVSGQASFSAQRNDTMSSIKVSYHAVCQTAPGP